MIFRQLFDVESSTYTYLFADPISRAAALIDPVQEHVERDLKLLKELDLKLAYVLETHVHADHITGAGLLRERTGAQTVGGKTGAICADLHCNHGDTIMLGTLPIRVLATPGHTDDSLSYWIGEYVCTGDALLIRGCGRTDFQNGDANQLYDSIINVLFALPENTVVLPAHDYHGFTSSSIAEEKLWNPRIAHQTKESFVKIMDNLNLPPPQKIQTAVTANQACGQTRQSA